MTTLRSTISQLANEFAAGVLDAIRGASLQEILAESGAGGVNGGGRGGRGGRAAGATRGAGRRGRPPAVAADEGSARSGAAAGRKRGRGGRLGRRSSGDIAGIVEQIVSLLASNPEGLRAEQIREQLGLEAKELPRPIAEALSSRKIAKQGQKRATTYFARGAGGGGKAGKGGTKSVGKKAARGGKRSAKKRNKANAASNGVATAS